MFRILQLLICLTAMAASEQQYRGYYPNWDHPRSASSLTKRGVSEPEGGQIIFDGPTADRRKATPLDDYKPEITDECKRLGYCPSVPNYPKELVRKLIDELPDKSIFNMDRLDPSTESNTTVDIVSRLGGTGKQATVSLCVASDQLIYPQAAPDETNAWQSIVNLEDNPVQGLRAEICSNPGNNCSSIMSLERGYTSECQQKFVYRMVATIDKHNKIVKKPLRFPSCCSCILHIVP